MPEPIRHYSFPTAITAGPGAHVELVDALRMAGVKRPLIVTDENLAPLEPVRRVVHLLETSGLVVRVFDGLSGNPVIAHVTQGVAAWRGGAHDGIVAIGGGASLDVAKCIALMAHHPGELLDYEDGKPGARPVVQTMPMVAALPTTAGTGSEVGRAAVISEDTTKVKRIIFHPRLLPRCVYLDATLCVGLPGEVTAATGLDTLTHLVEAYLVPWAHPMCDGIALEGLRLVRQYLKSCVDFANGAEGPTVVHLQARDAMLHAAMMGGVAFQKGLGASHSMAHGLSTVCDIHHGLANALVLPHVLGFNGVAAPEKFSALAAAVGAGDFIAWVVDLCAALGFPKNLSEVGVTGQQLGALADAAFADGCHATNPRAVSRDDFHALFVQALH